MPQDSLSDTHTKALWALQGLNPQYWKKRRPAWTYPCHAGVVTAVVYGMLLCASVLMSAAQMPENFKVAFIGDQGSGATADAVLQLIKNQGADMVIHSGDFDYSDNPTAWDRKITDILGVKFPYFASIGNHDTTAWSGSDGYQAKLQARLTSIPEAQCSGDLGVKSTCTYKGLFFILSGVGTMGTGHETYLAQQLAATNATWRICSWHKNQRLMQVGGKSDAVGWGAYETCREGGAIIATAHEHSYARTHLLSNTQTQTVASTSNTLQIKTGQTFVFHSGLGGKSIRAQQLDGPWWASIYTSTQGANYGALFCTFYVDQDPNKASCYFMSITGAVPDQFEVISAVTGGGGPPVNQPPMVDAGPNQTLPPGTVASLNGTVTDDGLPGSGLTMEWLQVSGPGAVNFDNAAAVNTTATFSSPGEYILQLTANDGEYLSSDTVTITVAPVHRETRTGGASSASTVTTAVSLTAANGDLYLVSVATRPYIAVSAVSGLGLTWQKVTAQCSGKNATGVEVWWALGTPSGNGSVTATLVKSATNAVIAVSRYTGADVAQPFGIVSANTKGVTGSCSGGTDTSTYTVPLLTTVDGTVAYGAVAILQRTHTPGAGYTERAEIRKGSSNKAAGLAVEDKTVAVATNVAVNGSFNSSVDWAVVGIEIKPQP